MLKASRRAYKRGTYLSRAPLSSYPHRPSPHLEKARRLYGVENMTHTKKLAQQTGCSVSALKQIIRKGEGAYFSSGSRPSQTAQSWGLARLASSITGGKAAAVDFAILEKGCDHKKKAYRLAVESRKKNKYGQRRTRKISI
jgi:DNA-binding Xre family transcriptional regulator